MISFGIIGLPNVGKSTLFNALSRGAAAEVSNYPFCTVEPNITVVAIPDERLDRLQAAFGQAKVVPAAMELVDIAGLVRGASRGEGLGNQFLARIREVDALLHVVRCFPDPAVVHVEDTVDPVRDIEIVETELCLADLATVERRQARTRAAAKSGDPRLRHELELLETLAAHLNAGRPARTLEAGAELQGLMQELFLLTCKPTLYVANIAEDPSSSADVSAAVQRYAAAQGSRWVEISARVEAEIGELEAEEAALFREELGFPEAALRRLLRASQELLGLITFFTGFRETGAPAEELRAWTLKAGTPAPVAAGKIHSDMEAGFIRAEVINVEALLAAGSWHHARETGRLAVHGRDYEVQDGDVILFRFRAP